MFLRMFGEYRPLFKIEQMGSEPETLWLFDLSGLDIIYVYNNKRMIFSDNDDDDYGDDDNGDQHNHRHHP